MPGVERRTAETIFWVELLVESEPGHRPPTPIPNSPSAAALVTRRKRLYNDGTSLWTTKPDKPSSMPNI
jgi:hypothetical protein